MPDINYSQTCYSIDNVSQTLPDGPTAAQAPSGEAELYPNQAADHTRDQTAGACAFEPTSDTKLALIPPMVLVSSPFAATMESPVTFAKPAPVLRRIGAAVIDRLIPLPFLVAVFWPWALVVLAYDLFRDSRGGSVGKRLLGLQTIQASSASAPHGQPCTLARSLRRNLLWAGARLCYLSVFLTPLGLACDVILGVMVCLAPDRCHLGDRIGGTRVVEAICKEGASR